MSIRIRLLSLVFLAVVGFAGAASRLAVARVMEQVTALDAAPYGTEEYREVNDFSASLTEILGVMSELHIGGDRILSALTMLLEVTANVKTGFTSITSSSDKIKETMPGVQRISSEVRGGMAVGLRRYSAALDADHPADPWSGARGGGLL
jgi:hypothetical protein